MTATPDPMALAIAALIANPAIHPRETQLEALRVPGNDLTFEELGMDSMGRMELSIWLELEVGIEVSESRLKGIGSFTGLVEFIAAHLREG